MKKIKILITSCHGKTGYLLAAQLKKSKYYDYEVFGSDMNKKKLQNKYFEKIFKRKKSHYSIGIDTDVLSQRILRAGRLSCSTKSIVNCSIGFNNNAEATLSLKTSLSKFGS